MPTAKKNPVKKKAPKANVAAKKSSTSRMLKKPAYRSFRIHKRIRPHQAPLPSGRSLFKQTFAIFNKNRRLYLGLSLVYILLSLVLVRGFSSALDLATIRDGLKDTYGGVGGGLLSVPALFSLLTSSGSTASETVNASGSAYQTMIIICTCLTTIWALRQSTAGHKVRAKDAYYKGLYPLVPFILVMLVITLQLIPFFIGSWLYAAVVSGGIAITALEKTLWVLVVILFFTLSMYMVASSTFGLFVVTLPDMTPLRALRSARKLVLHRRWVVARKLLFLPFILFLVAVVVMTPFLLLLPVIAEWVFFCISGVGWIFAIGYIYNLYRSLLNE